MAAEALKNINLTLVHYVPGDRLGLALGYITLTPVMMVVSYVTVIVSRREVAPSLMFLGQLISEVLNSVLKRLIRQERPTKYLGRGYGMPSSHCQFAGFLMSYGLLYLWHQIHFKNNLFQYVISVGLVLWTSLVAYSRVYLRYHSTSQIFFGLAIGCLFGFLWYAFVECVIRPSSLFKRSLNSPVASYLSIRDSRDIPDIWDFEYRSVTSFNSTSVKKSQ